MKNLLNEELIRIQEIMGLKTDKNLLLEGETPVQAFLEKILDRMGVRAGEKAALNFERGLEQKVAQQGAKFEATIERLSKLEGDAFEKELESFMKLEDNLIAVEQLIDEAGGRALMSNLGGNIMTSIQKQMGANGKLALDRLMSQAVDNGNPDLLINYLKSKNLIDADAIIPLRRHLEEKIDVARGNSTGYLSQGEKVAEKTAETGAGKASGAGAEQVLTKETEDEIYTFFETPGDDVLAGKIAKKIPGANSAELARGVQRVKKIVGNEIDTMTDQRLNEVVDEITAGLAPEVKKRIQQDLKPGLWSRYKTLSKTQKRVFWVIFGGVFGPAGGWALGWLLGTVKNGYQSGYENAKSGYNATQPKDTTGQQPVVPVVPVAPQPKKKGKYD